MALPWIRRAWLAAASAALLLAAAAAAAWNPFPMRVRCGVRWAMWARPATATRSMTAQ